MKKRILYLAALAFMTGTLSWCLPESVLAAPEMELAAEDYLAEAEELIVAELNIQGPAGVQEAAAAAIDAVAEDSVRDNLVDYALQFVGGKYRAGGNDPHTGADCSGFVKYVLQNGAGVTMNRSSAAQASQGVAINADQMQPGDLIFYSSGSRINHVAMYIGGGQIVHASTYSTGIKISDWNYRAPVKIVNVLG